MTCGSARRRTNIGEMAVSEVLYRPDRAHPCAESKPPEPSQVENDGDKARITWSGARPDDFAEWEAIIHDVMRQWRAGGEVVIEGHEGVWRVASALADAEPRDPKRDNARRHRVTEALRARGKAAGLHKAPPS